MAQRTGADGLIAPAAKIASAGVILALAIAAMLALSGCGGGSSSSEAKSTSSSSASAEKASVEDPAGKAPGATESSQSSPSGQASGSSPSTSTPGSAPSQGSGGKQGPHIKIPKGEPERAATPEELEEATVADISLASPALGSAGGALPSTYTCDGKDTWPQLRWSGIPPGSKELALYAMNVQPVEGKLFFDWALAGLDPGLEGLEAGELPKGAVSGKNSFGKAGYSICPSAGSAETYLFILFALPKALHPSRGFDPGTLRDQILALSGNAGLLAASYSRG